MAPLPLAAPQVAPPEAVQVQPVKAERLTGIGTAMAALVAVLGPLLRTVTV